MDKNLQVSSTSVFVFSRLHKYIVYLGLANRDRQPELLPWKNQSLPALLFLLTTLRSRFNTGPILTHFNTLNLI